jgi:hypothetical protein
MKHMLYRIPRFGDSFLDTLEHWLFFRSGVLVGSGVQD